MPTKRENELERDFQARVIKELYIMFPDCIVLKQDPNYQQGIPDLLILFRDRWAALEVKRTEKSRRQPNQPYFVELTNSMSFGRFLHTANKEEIFEELRVFFR